MKASSCASFRSARFTPIASWRLGSARRSLSACWRPGVTSDRASLALAGGAASAGRALVANRPSATRKTTVRRMILGPSRVAHCYSASQSRALIVYGLRPAFNGQEPPDSNTARRRRGAPAPQGCVYSRRELLACSFVLEVVTRPHPALPQRGRGIMALLCLVLG